MLRVLMKLLPGDLASQKFQVNEMKKCESCGSPMTELSHFGGQNRENQYCSHCSLQNGTLRPRFEIEEKLITYYMKVKKMDRAEAQAFVSELMARMPAWQ